MAFEDKVAIRELLAATLWVSTQIAKPEKKLHSYLRASAEERSVMRKYADWLVSVGIHGEDEKLNADLEKLFQKSTAATKETGNDA